MNPLASLALALSLSLVGGCVSTHPFYVSPTTGTEGYTSGDDASDAESASSTSGGDTLSTSSGDTTSAPLPSTTAAVTTGETGTLDTGSDPICGDGVVDPGEACDDGNDVDDDMCTGACTLPACGDQILQGDEECDDGDANGVGGSCTQMCKVNVCGDGVPGIDEECDDGNDKGGDGCSASCMQEKCGNMVVDPGELCDDGNNVDLDGCTSLCVPPPQLGDLIIDGLSQTIGPGGGEPLGGNECAGVIVGFAGEFDAEATVVANLSGLCVDPKLESKGNGIFRLVQAGEPYNAGDKLGGVPPKPIPFSTQCQDPGTLLWSVGGYTTLSGISEIGLQCTEILVKPVNGSYKLFPQPPVMEPPVGMPKGMLVNPPANCSGYPGTFPGGFEVDGVDLVLGLTLRCHNPGVAP